jgi:type II secretory pathway component HofQ
MDGKRLSGAHDLTPAAEFLRRVADALGVDAVCLPDVAERVVNWTGGDVPAGRVLADALADSGLAYRLVDGVLVVGTPERIRALPEPDSILPRPTGEGWGKRVTFEFADASARSVLDAITKVSGTDVMLLGEAGGSTTLAATDLPALTAVRLLAVVTGLRAEERWGTVVLGTPAALAALGPAAGEAVADDAASAAALRLLRSARISLRFDGTPVEDALGVLAAAARVEVTVAGGVDPSGTVTGSAAGTVEDLLRLVLRPHGLTFRIEDGKVVVAARE